MPLPLVPFIAAAITFLLREVVVKFVVFSAVFALVAFLVPFAVRFLGGFVSPSLITSGFGLIDSGVWYILKYFRVDYGVPLIVSAYVARFLIRRLPLIG